MLSFNLPLFWASYMIYTDSKKLAYRAIKCHVPTWSNNSFNSASWIFPVKTRSRLESCNAKSLIYSPDLYICFRFITLKYIDPYETKSWRNKNWIYTGFPRKQIDSHSSMYTIWPFSVKKRPFCSSFMRRRSFPTGKNSDKNFNFTLKNSYRTVRFRK